jgi:hypothetical protein
MKNSHIDSSVLGVIMSTDLLYRKCHIFMWAALAGVNTVSVN